MDIDSLIAEGLEHHRAGRLNEAEAIYRRALDGAPGHHDAVHLLGLVALARGDAARAIALIGEAVAAHPDVVALQASLGDALLAAGRNGEAGAAFERVLADDPSNVGAAINLSGLRSAAKRHAEASDLARRAVSLAPDMPEAHAALGTAILASGRPSDALDALERALALDPNFDQARAAHALALTGAGRHSEADAEYRRLIERKPDAPERLVNYAVALRRRGMNDDAAPLLERALALAPDMPEAFNALGLVRRAMRRNDEAIALFERAIAARPKDPDPLNNLGHLLIERNEVDAGIALLERAVELDPDHMTAWGNLIQGFDTREPEEDPRRLGHRRKLDRHLLSKRPMRTAWNVARDPERKLRVGYIGPDFHSNSAGLLAAPIVTNHDPATVEVFCYPDSPLVDAVTERYRRKATAWRPIAGLGDDAVEDMIVADRIDVLIDLAGYAGARLAALARKPAPVQLSGWGFGHGMGLSAYDGVLLDSVVAPPELAASYIEPVLRLPVWLCFEPPAHAPEPGPLPAARRGYPTFGCFNRVAKLQETTLLSFAGVLSAVPEARLVFKDGSVGDPAVQASLRDRIAAHGGDAARIDFLGATPHEAHLAAIADVDVMLNPYPYGGGMSAVESLWMGAPIVAQIGIRQQARGCAAFLDYLGLGRFVATDPAGYIETVARAVRDLDALAATRASLRARMKASLLCDPPHYTRAVEEIYRTLWRRWCATGRAT